MKHSNISIFVPHVGCPCDCSFCNQKKITGQQKQPNEQDIISAVETAVSYNKNMENTELAFFGGSFTAIEKQYRTKLLTVGAELVEKYCLKGIRISTRPDCIDKEILQELKKYKVVAIELGAQSMFDSVLLANNRGHLASDTEKASKLVKEMGFELGLQMMTGLYGSTQEMDLQTAEKIVELCPNTLRLYPTIVFENTRLCDYYQNGKYKPQPLSVAVKLCSKIILLCEKVGVKVIRVGLHSTDEVAKAVTGPYHPAFKELCESEIYYNKFKNELKITGDYTIHVNPTEVSKATGQKKSNIQKLAKMHYNIKIQANEKVEKGQFILEGNL